MVQMLGSKTDTEQVILASDYMKQSYLENESELDEDTVMASDTNNESRS
jgi:hypothetical protein